MKLLKLDPARRPGERRLLVLATMWLFGGHVLAMQSVPQPTGSTDAPRSGPTITVVGGDNQTGAPGEFNTKPFDIAVWNATGTEPLVDTEVTFTVLSGGGLLASTKDAAAQPSYTLMLKTDQDGTVQAYYKQPFVPGLLSQIKATAADGEILLLTTTLGVGESSEDSASTGKQSGSTKSGSASGQGSGVVIAFANSATSAAGKSSNRSAKVAALTGLVSQVLLKTPSANYTVNTSSWAISAYGGQ